MLSKARKLYSESYAIASATWKKAEGSSIPQAGRQDPGPGLGASQLEPCLATSLPTNHRSCRCLKGQNNTPSHLWVTAPHPDMMEIYGQTKQRAAGLILKDLYTFATSPE